MLNKIIITAISLILGLNFMVQSQEKTSVGIIPFTYTKGMSLPANVVTIEQEVISSFVETKRFDIVDRTKMDALQKEKELQKSEEFIDSKVVAQGASLGAQYLISGHVNSATASEYTATDSKTGKTVSGGYKSKLSITLKVIDVGSGQVVASETIEPKGGSLLSQMAGVAPTTAQAAIEKAIRDIKKKIDGFVSKNFPLTFKIVEILEKDGKGVAKKVLISGGSKFGLKRKLKLDVIENVVVEVDGKSMTRKKSIGKLKIAKVDDANFSQCDVKEGGKDIFLKFEKKTKLEVITLSK